MNAKFRILLAVMVFGSCTLAAPAQPPAREPLVDKVKNAIARGVQFLRDSQVVSADGKEGNWEIDAAISNLAKGGETNLALLALLNAGVKPTDPLIQRGLNYTRKLELDNGSTTYMVGLQTMVFAAAGFPEDKERIQRNVDWLIDARYLRDGQLRGWSYTKRRSEADNSNTQYALLGLHDGHMAGAKIDPAVWQSIREFYMRTQKLDANADLPGAWGYNPDRPEKNESRLTMTTAGLCGLLIAGMELNDRRETLLPNGTAANCGVYQENRNVKAAVGWVSERFRIDLSRDSFPVTYYNLYGIERAGRLTGYRFFGRHDWYREGCEFLTDGKHQAADGSWAGGFRGQDGWPLVSTSFALLFLSKGRTPVLISKLAHGPGDDWNNDKNDARNLTAFISKELFKRQPLAWQVFDARRATADTAAERLEVARELLQSPIAYFNGHAGPVFEGKEIEILKNYVDQGGFILAEACCGRQAFDTGLQALVKNLFEEGALKKLDPMHPVWRSHYIINPNNFELYGVEMGCKTVLIYSKKDLSCTWEANTTEDEAFRLGANIVAYATGLEMPKPRLSEAEFIAAQDEPGRIPRGFLKVAQLRHEGDWQPAPHAMRNLMAYMRDKPRIDVALQTEEVHPNNSKVLDFKFLYMHGRGEFNYRGKSLDNLRSNLQTGGLLFADAACGRKVFDAAFRNFVEKSLFPGRKLEPIPLSDDLFGKEVNGEVIATVRCRQEKPDGSGPEAEMKEMPPVLEGIKIDKRWVVIYSRYDIGCALEKTRSSDCLGHDYPSALKLGAAVVLYFLKR